jgi:hypothetical protein
MNLSNSGSSSKKNEDSLQGYILMLPYGSGSKSESLRPVLLRSNQKIVQICFCSDNPFTNVTLKPLHLKYCQISGHFEGTDFIVESAEQLADPASESHTPVKE